MLINGSRLLTEIASFLVVPSVVGAEGPVWVQHHTGIMGAKTRTCHPLKQKRIRPHSPQNSDLSLQNPSAPREGLQLAYKSRFFTSKDGSAGKRHERSRRISKRNVIEVHVDSRRRSPSVGSDRQFPSYRDAGFTQHVNITGQVKACFAVSY